MSTLTGSANGKAFPACEHRAEKLTFASEIEDEVDERGVMMARPSHARVFISKEMRRQTGALQLLNLAILSQRFNLLAEQKDKHPKAVLTEETKRGNQTIPLSQLHLEDFQAEDYRLKWVGSGNDGLHGCTVAEQITLIAAAGKVVNMIDNSEAPFDFR